MYKEPKVKGLEKRKLDERKKSHAKLWWKPKQLSSIVESLGQIGGKEEMKGKILIKLGYESQE